MQRQLHETRPAPSAPVRLLVALMRFLHYAVLAFALTAWAVPVPGVLIAHMALMPALLVQWRFNNNTCLLDTLESRLVHGVWRAPDRNPDEGRFVANLIQKVFGIALSTAAGDRVVYGLMALLFTFSAVHLILLWT